MNVLLGSQQLAQHMVVWSQISPILVVQNPVDGFTRGQASSEQLQTLNSYVRDIRSFEIKLLKILGIQPDPLNRWLKKTGHDFPRFVRRLSPKPAWIADHPRHASSAIDDMHQLSWTVRATKTRLNNWAAQQEAHPRKRTVLKPPGLTANVTWLYDVVSVRADLATMSVRVASDGNKQGINHYYDRSIRKTRDFHTWKESLQLYHGIKLPGRPSR